MVEADARYGAVGLSARADVACRPSAAGSRGFPRGWRVGAVAVAGAAASLVACGMLALRTRGGSDAAGARAVVLSDEVGAFGTALSDREQADADDEFEDTFPDDPGHTSRGEIRFNAALRAMGGRNPSERRRRYRQAPERRPIKSQWTVIPEPDEKPSKVAVNIRADVTQPRAARSHLGFTDTEARSDLDGYFSALAAQASNLRKQHAEQELGLRVEDGGGSGSSKGSESRSARQSLGARGRVARRSHGQRLADQKVTHVTCVCCVISVLGDSQAAPLCRCLCSVSVC